MVWAIFHENYRVRVRVAIGFLVRFRAMVRYSLGSWVEVMNMVIVQEITTEQL